MRSFRKTRLWPMIYPKKIYRSFPRSVSPSQRKELRRSNLRRETLVPLPWIFSRSHSTSHTRMAETRPSFEADEPPDDPLFYYNLSQSVPYLEAYNLMEENADIIFENENMIKERSFTLQDAMSLGPSAPRPASEIPGPKSWPLVGCLPYMMRHKDFDPKRVYLFWRSVREEFGPIFRKDMPGHPNMVFITDPADLQKMYQSTMYNPVRPGMQSLKKIRGPGGADGKTNTYYRVFRGKAGILAEYSYLGYS